LFLYKLIYIAPDKLTEMSKQKEQILWIILYDYGEDNTRQSVIFKIIIQALRGNGKE
jgi:hypothetical protein